MAACKLREALLLQTAGATPVLLLSNRYQWSAVVQQVRVCKEGGTWEHQSALIGAPECAHSMQAERAHRAKASPHPEQHPENTLTVPCKNTAEHGQHSKHATQKTRSGTQRHHREASRGKPEYNRIQPLARRPRAWRLGCANLAAALRPGVCVCVRVCARARTRVCIYEQLWIGV